MTHRHFSAPILLGLGALVALVVAIGCAIYDRSSDVPLPPFIPIRCLNDVGPGQVCMADDLSEEERRLMESGRQLKDGNYFQRAMPAGTLEIVDDTLSEIRLRREAPAPIRREAARCGGDQLAGKGVLAEFPGRWSAVYVDRKGRRIYLVRGDFESYGGSVGFIASNMLLRVNGAPATAVLATNPRVSDALWTVDWATKGVSFDLSVEDRIDKSGNPTKWSIAEVLALAEGIDSRCHWDRLRAPA